MKNPLLDQTYVRVFRGGSWGNLAWGSRVSYRYRRNASYRNYRLGFRLFRTQELK